MGRKGVHRLQTHTVQTHGLLIALRVILSARVEDADRLDHGIQRNASSEVPYGNLLLCHGDLYLLSETCGELVDRVVHNLLEQHVDTVCRIVTLSKGSDVHTRSEPDMLDTFKGLDVVVCVIRLIYILCRHIRKKT